MLALLLSFTIAVVEAAALPLDNQPTTSIPRTSTLMHTFESRAVNCQYTAKGCPKYWWAYVLGGKSPPL